MNISLFSKFRVFFVGKNGSLAKRKNGCFSVILAGTRSVVIFFMAPTVPPSFVEDGPKLRVIIIAK